jgi:hypothetical protein
MLGHTTRVKWDTENNINVSYRTSYPIAYFTENNIDYRTRQAIQLQLLQRYVALPPTMMVLQNVRHINMNFFTWSLLSISHSPVGIVS